MVQHLYTNYGKVSPTDLEENDMRMREPFDPSKRVEELYEQIEDTVEYSEAANAAYNDTQVVCSRT